MLRDAGTIEAVAFGGEGATTVSVRCSPGIRPHPGQAILLLHLSQPTTIRHTVHPTKITDGGFRMHLPAQASWHPGDSLDLVGPIGRPFRPPAGARRWLLVASGAPADALLPLVDAALATGADVTLASSSRPAGLPADVEVLRSPADAFHWADYLAACVPRRSVGGLLRDLDAHDHSMLPGQSEVMVLSPLPCGIGACGVCAVATVDGWDLCCHTGLVYPLSRLRE
jgi:hypothetical protein